MLSPSCRLTAPAALNHPWLQEAQVQQTTKQPTEGLSGMELQPCPQVGEEEDGLPVAELRQFLARQRWRLLRAALRPSRPAPPFAVCGIFPG